MQGFHRYYFDSNEFQSITHQDMKKTLFNYLRENYDSNFANEKMAAIGWDEWIFGIGMPPAVANFTTPNLVKA
jgi:hypothetical protein